MRALPVLFVACAGSAQQVETAKQWRYDTDVEVVRAGVVDAVRTRYPTLEVEPHLVKFAWLQVKTSTPTGNATAATRHFVRLDVRIGDRRPWSIDVVAHGARWDRGDVAPAELRGIEEPTFVKQRADELRVRIHEQLAQYATPK